MNPVIGQCSLKNGTENIPKTFTFDGVYYIDSTAEHIYNDIVYPLIEVIIKYKIIFKNKIFFFRML